MRLRAFCLLIFSFCFALTVTAQIPNSRPLNGFERNDSLITGTLYGLDGMGVGGAHIELRDASSNAVLAFTTTRSNGTFELYNMGTGTYELLAESQGTQCREFVSVNGPVNHIELRLTHAASASNQNGQRTSVARLKVPGRARDRYNNAADQFAHGKFDKAEKSVNESLSMYQQNPEALTLRGLLAWHNKDADQAIQDFQQAMAIDPDYEVPYAAMSAIFNSNGNYDDAVRQTERAVAINPNAWQGYFEQAKALLGKGLYGKALEVANKAQTLGPAEFAAFHLLKAYAMVPLKLYKDAGTELQAFLSHAPRGQDTSSVKLLLAKVEAEAAAVPPVPAPSSGMALVSH